MAREKLKVKSPCTGQCYIPRDSRTCSGCYRTDMEIFDWSELDSFERSLIVQRAKARKALAKSDDSGET